MAPGELTLLVSFRCIFLPSIVGSSILLRGSRGWYAIHRLDVAARHLCSTGLNTYMSGDGRTVQSVARNPMQATQARTAKALSSVPDHVFHGSIAWLNMSMSGVSHEFFAGLAEADRAQSEKLASSEILDIASQFVTRPYTEEELKEVLKDAARKAYELRTGRRPDPDKVIKIPQPYFPNESVAIAPTEAATGRKWQASAETRKVVDADLDTHRRLACPARTAYVLLRDSQEKQMDLLRDHFALLAGGHAGSLDSASVLQILDFCDQCAGDADSMMVQMFLMPAANLSARVMKPVAASTKKSKFGTAVPPSAALVEQASLRMVPGPVSTRPTGLAGRWGANTANKAAQSPRSDARKGAALSQSQKKNRSRRLQAAAAKKAGAESVAATPEASSSGTPSASKDHDPGVTGVADVPAVQKGTAFVTPKAKQGRGSGRGGSGRGRGSSRGRGRGGRGKKPQAN